MYGGKEECRQRESYFVIGHFILYFGGRGWGAGLVS